MPCTALDCIPHTIALVLRVKIGGFRSSEVFIIPAADEPFGTPESVDRLVSDPLLLMLGEPLLF